MFHTIRFRVFILNLIFLLTIFGFIMSAVFTSALAMLRTNEMHYNVEATNRTKDRFAFVLDSVTRAVKNLREKTELNQMLKSDLTFSKDEYAQVKNRMSTVLKDVIYNSPYLSGVHVIGIDTELFFSSMPSVQEASLRQLYEPFLVNKVRPKSYFTGFRQIEYYPGYRKTVIEYVNPIYNIESATLSAVLIVDIDYNALEEMFLMSSMGNEDKAIIISPEGEVLFKYPYNINFDSVLTHYPQLLTEGEKQFTGKVFGTEMFIVSSTIEHTDWQIIRMLSPARITKDTQKIQRIIAWTIAIVVLLCLVLSDLLSRALTKNITTLSKAFHHAENGDMSIRVNIKSKDELGRLGSSFNVMMQMLEGHMAREIEERQQKSDMELQVLQAQVNPHFLYNTLDSIKWLAMLQNVNNIAEMTTALIHLLRYNLSKDGSTVTLADEIMNVTNYVRVQKYRYGDGFVLNEDIAQEARDCLMPRFMLQPLVENCILHAFSHRVTQGVIIIRSFIKNDMLYIRVIDDGQGMDIEKVLTEIEKGDRFKNIGVNNLRERIRINYGAPYGLSYQSSKDGTTAEITLPVRRRDGSITNEMKQ